jgi:hypothetical protein
VALNLISSVQDALASDFLANPHISDYRGDTTISCLFYGPAALAAYLRVYEGKDHSDGMLQLFVNHYAELRQRIRKCSSEEQVLTQEPMTDPKTTATATPAIPVVAPLPTTKMKTKSTKNKKNAKQQKSRKGK